MLFTKANNYAVLRIASKYFYGFLKPLQNVNSYKKALSMNLAVNCMINIIILI